MRFATRVLLVQLATVGGVVAVCAAVFTALSVQQLHDEAQSTALSIARTVAADPDVSRLVAEWSADPGTPAATDLVDGDLQVLASGTVQRTGALFVVITDDHGIRLAHPDPSRLGEVVSTGFQDALAGRETVSWERGTLGDSARAKVPVYPPDGGAAVGEVSVGFAPASVYDDLPGVLVGVGIAAVAALLLGVLATMLLRRRWERLTLGLQPEELVALVQNQAAVLEGVGDGVMALDTRGIVRVSTSTAERLLGATDLVGRPLAASGLAPHVAAALTAPEDAAAAPHATVVVDDRVLVVDRLPVVRGGRALGDVIVVRDRTDLESLAGRLESVRVMTGALRVQRHEFANRAHVVVGLLDAGRVDDARTFAGELEQRGPVEFAVDGIERIGDGFLQALVGAKGMATRERGVTLRVSDDTLLVGRLEAVEDVAAVLGNLVDNAVTATLGAPPPRWVEISLLDDGTDLVVVVSDSGPGIDAGRDVFARRPEPADPGQVHGRGIGLPLSRDLARRRGGDVWVVDPGGGAPPSGAVFAARLAGAMSRGDGEDGHGGEEER